GGWQQGPNAMMFNVMRLTSAGAMDSSFGVGGIGTSGDLVNLGTTYGEVSMALQPGGETGLVSTAFPDTFAAAPFDGDPPRLGASLPAHAVVTSITSDQVQPLLAEAEARWQAAGVDTSILGAIKVRIADLGGATLGFASDHTIWLDDNAAGWGWFVDRTP